MATIKESILVSWTIENNDAGAWALFFRLGGERTQMTPWFETKAELVETLKARLAASSTNDTPNNSGTPTV